MSGDVYRFINDQDDAVVERLVERLEFRDGNPIFAGWREAYFAALPLGSARVLDVGCGTGVNTRALASWSPRPDRVVGVDLSPRFVEVARRLAEERGLADRVDFVAGDSHELAFEDASFDVVVAHTLISHVTDPARVIHEMARVVKPGGMVAIFDGDYASWSYAHPDDALARAFEEGIIRAVVNNPRVLRNAPRMLGRAGLTIEASMPNVLAEVGTGSFWLSAAEAYGPLVGRGGYLPQEQVEAWLSWQREAAASGMFFAASNYYTYLARRP